MASFGLRKSYNFPQRRHGFRGFRCRKKFPKKDIVFEMITPTDLVAALRENMRRQYDLCFQAKDFLFLVDTVHVVVYLTKIIL